MSLFELSKNSNPKTVLFFRRYKFDKKFSSKYSAESLHFQLKQKKLYLYPRYLSFSKRCMKILLKRDLSSF